MSVALALDLEWDGDTLLCASTAWTNGVITVPQLWTSTTRAGFVPLTETTILALLEHLWESRVSGVMLVTWGGTSTDWVALHRVAPGTVWRDRVKTMARDAVDIPLVSAAANGMMMGLVSAAVGMGLGSRPSINSEDVARQWRSGDAVAQNEVLQHVIWDAWACAQIYNRLIVNAQGNRPALVWITQKSGPRTVRLHRVREGGDLALWTLPRTREVMTWDTPQTNFKVPEHLRASEMWKWLETTS